MTKNLPFDLHFTATEVVAVSPRGRAFLDVADITHRHMRNLYLAAIDAGMHVRFENATVRDLVAACSSTVY